MESSLKLRKKCVVYKVQGCKGEEIMGNFVEIVKKKKSLYVNFTINGRSIDANSQLNTSKLLRAYLFLIGLWDMSIYLYSVKD